jgi:hypothetical protein
MKKFQSTRVNLLKKSTTFAHVAILKKEFAPEVEQKLSWAKLYLLSKVSKDAFNDVAELLQIARNKTDPKLFFESACELLRNLFLKYFSSIEELVQGDNRDDFLKLVDDLKEDEDVSIHSVRTLVVNDHIERGLRDFNPEIDF